MRQALTAEDFVTGESLKSAGILDVFPTFQTARMGQKIRCSAEAELFRGSLAVYHIARRFSMVRACFRLFFLLQ